MNNNCKISICLFNPLIIRRTNNQLKHANKSPDFFPYRAPIKPVSVVRSYGPKTCQNESALYLSASWRPRNHKQPYRQITCNESSCSVVFPGLPIADLGTIVDLGSRGSFLL